MFVHFDSWSAWTQTSKLLHSRMSAFPLSGWRFNSWIWWFVSGVILRRVASPRFLILAATKYIYICNFYVSLKTLTLLRQRHSLILLSSCHLLCNNLVFLWSCRLLWILQSIDIDYYWAIVMLGHLVYISSPLLWILNHVFKLDFLQIFKNHLFGKYRKYPRFYF